MAEAGARLAIRLLQDAAERGEIDPWDVDVIAVVDGFLDQLQHRLVPAGLISGQGGRFERDLADSSEAFLAASVLVALKAEVLEISAFPPESLSEAGFEAEEAQDPTFGAAIALPSRPERHLRRRPVAPPPLQRPVTLGELIRHLESIAAQLEDQEPRSRSRPRARALSESAAIAQVTNLAHREKLPETTAALSLYLITWPAAAAGGWVPFERLVADWAAAAADATDDLDRDRVGVFWALLFLSAQGKVELEQRDGLFGPLQLRRSDPAALPAGAGIVVLEGPDGGPALKMQAA